MQLILEMRNACRIWSKNLKGRYYLGDLRLDGDNIKMDLRETGYEGVDWTHLGKCRDQ
jgi:hypothetical protein